MVRFHVVGPVVGRRVARPAVIGVEIPFAVSRLETTAVVRRRRLVGLVLVGLVLVGLVLVGLVLVGLVLVGVVVTRVGLTEVRLLVRLVGIGNAVPAHP